MNISETMITADQEASGEKRTDSGVNRADRTARVIAFYLPQYHPIPENDDWWELGFTEWTNVTKAKPLYRGHYQPHLPADLGFYDLRVAETRQAQADLAQAYGVEGFCYWHYWFGAGKRLLERPFQEVLHSGAPHLPFCLAWANENWAGYLHGAKDRLLLEQTYPGVEDYIHHYRAIEDALADPRYILIEGRPLFVVYKPQLLPDSREFIRCWQDLREQSGLPAIYFVGMTDGVWNPVENGFDAAVLNEPRPVINRLPVSLLDRLLRRWTARDISAIGRKLFGSPTVYHYADIVRHCRFSNPGYNNFPCVIPNWDNTPRAGKHGIVFHGSRPELFAKHFRLACDYVSGRDFDQRIVFLKSWNEWAEGNYVEPDRRFGRRYLEVIKDAVVGRTI